MRPMLLVTTHLEGTPKISHLDFSDDIMLFFDGKDSSLQEITYTLDRFQLLSGLMMNKEKTSLFYAGMNQSEADSLSFT